MPSQTFKIIHNDEKKMPSNIVAEQALIGSILFLQFPLLKFAVIMV